MIETYNMLSTRHLGFLILFLSLMSGQGLAEPALGKIKLFAMDIETTGLSPSNDRIIEISIIEFSGTNIGSRSTWLINPERTIPASSTRVHGITDKMVKGRPTFASIAHDIHKLISNSTVVAHNARFDWQFIMAEFTRNKAQQPKARVIDSIKLAKSAFPGLKSYALPKLCKHLEISTVPTHRAESDTEALVTLIQRCFESIGTNRPSSTLDNFLYTPRASAEKATPSP